MDYVPVYEGDGAADGTVTISADRVQILGVRTEAARTQVLATPIRAVGTIAADERRLAVVAPRFEGWIQELIANTTASVSDVASRCSPSTVPKPQRRSASIS